MRRLLLHLSTSVVAFILGLATAMIFGVFSFTRTESRVPTSVYVEPPPAPRACPNAPRFHQGMPGPPLAPMPPAPHQKGTRVVIRRSDGSVEIIETEKRVERKQSGS